MPSLDDTLIELFSNKSKDASNKSKILVTEDVRFHKVAFDMVKVYGDHYNDLWRMEDIDGDTYLIRASDPKYGREEQGSWSAVSDFDSANVTLSYKNVPVCRFASEEYEFCSDDILTFKSALLGRVEEDAEFVKEVLLNQPGSKVEALSSTFPELKEFIK